MHMPTLPWAALSTAIWPWRLRERLEAPACQWELAKLAQVHETRIDAGSTCDAVSTAARAGSMAMALAGLRGRWACGRGAAELVCGAEARLAGLAAVVSGGGGEDRSRAGPRVSKVKPQVRKFKELLAIRWAA